MVKNSKTVNNRGSYSRIMDFLPSLFGTKLASVVVLAALIAQEKTA